MGQRGVAKRPTVIEVLRGKPGRRPLGNEPHPVAVGDWTCPEWLAGLGREEWERRAPILRTAGLLTDADLPAFAAYCHAYADWRECKAFVDEHGKTMHGQNGFRMACPEWNQMLASRKAMLDLAKQFGMTPSARAGMSVKGKNEDEDPLEQFLAKGKKSA